MLGRYAPPSALVNDDFEVQQFRGRTSPYFETPSGQPTTNILRMAKPGLFMELRSALTEAKATNGPVVREGLHVIDGSDDIEFTLRVLPVRLPQHRRVLSARAVRIDGLAGMVRGLTRAG